MIIKALYAVFFGIVEGIIALFPKGEPPAFIVQASGLMHEAFLAANGLGAWIPWSVAIATAGVVFTIWGILLVISGMRWLVGWIPTMGGA